MIKYLRYIFFYFEWKTTTRLSIYEIKDLFSRNIESVDEVREKGKKQHRQFVGVIKETGFEVYRFSSWKYSFARPKIYGYFNTYEGGTKLKAKFTISFGRFAKSIFTLLGILAIQVLLTYYFYPNGDDLSVLRTFVLPVFLISLIALTFINFWYEVLNSVSIMQSILRKEGL